MRTVAAIATPHGVGAVAVVRLSGRDALGIAARLLAPGPARRLERGARRLLAAFHHPASMECVDRGLVHVFRAPRSFTGEDVVELHGHGGHVAPRRVLEAALAAGAFPAEPGEFTRRALLNGKLDLLQAEATLDLIEARGEELGRQAVYQLGGALSRRLDRLRGALVGVMALAETQIDFPEEDLAAPPDWAASVAGVRGELAGLLEGYRAGGILRHGAAVVIAGAPNVGKSRLFNLLLGEERSIVTATPGTTRDAVEAEIECGGIVLRLIDTAGIREARDEVEALGVELSRRHLQGARLVVVVLEATRPPSAEELALLSSLSGRPHVIALSKVDLLSCVTSATAGEEPGLVSRHLSQLSDHNWECLVNSGQLESHGFSSDDNAERDAISKAAAGVPRMVFTPRMVMTSAVTGEGREALLAALREAIDAVGPSPGCMLSTVRCRAAAEAAVGSLDRALQELESRSPGPERLAADLREGAERLAEMIGTVTDEHVLDEIFSRFCVGK